MSWRSWPASTFTSAASKRRIDSNGPDQVTSCRLHAVGPWALTIGSTGQETRIAIVQPGN